MRQISVGFPRDANRQAWRFQGAIGLPRVQSYAWLHFGSARVEYKSGLIPRLVIKETEITSTIRRALVFAQIARETAQKP